MSQLFVKICGISTMDAAVAVADSGADAIGFVFAPGSPREVTAEQARVLASELPPSIDTVGVFRNQPIDTVLRTAANAGLRTVQLHGSETDAEFDRLRAEGFDAIRAISIDDYLRLSLAGAVRPHGVDVSSGVEISRGVKGPSLIRDFVAAARAA